MSDQVRNAPAFDPAGALRWGWRLADELSRLPESIAQWREGVAIFVSVARRLDAATANIEQLLRQVEAAGLVDQLQRLQALTTELGRDMTGGGVATGEQMLNETRRNVEALARLLAGPADRSSD